MILVSGIHRSGSTFLGKIISKHPKVKYIHEPFNLDYPKTKKPIDFWYQYVNENTSRAKQKEILDYINSFYKLDSKSIQLSYARSTNLKSFLKTTIDLIKRSENKVPLIKDPIAILSADWIYKKLQPKTIISIRHPSAFVASIKVKNWEFDFKHLEQQHDLVETKLINYKDQISEYVKNPPNIIEQGILVWNIIHEIIYEYKREHNGWYFIKNEDISLDPIKEFEKIFGFLELDFNKEVKTEIIESTTSNIPSKLKRNSKENIKSWKKRLSKEEIEKIKSETKMIWEKFYSEKDW
jgi:hypothetical protein